MNESLGPKLRVDTGNLTLTSRAVKMERIVIFDHTNGDVFVDCELFDDAPVVNLAKRLRDSLDDIITNDRPPYAADRNLWPFQNERRRRT